MTCMFSFLLPDLTAQLTVQSEDEANRSDPGVSVYLLRIMLYILITGTQISDRCI